MDSVIKDIRYAVRRLLRQPSFTLITIVTLALGIGANTAIFSIVYSVLLKPLPFYRPDRIVVLWGEDRAQGDSRSQVSHTDIVDYRAQQTVFDSITSMFVLGAFAVLALALAAIGIYGVMSYVVAQRTNEIGIRIALGAGFGNILGLVLRNALYLAMTGIVLGGIAAFALTRLMKSLLFGVAPTDLLTFVVVCSGLIVVALLASYLPARRATRVDPLRALRSE